MHNKSAAPVKPSAVDPYIDAAQMWLCKPAGPSTLAKLGKACGHLYSENGPSRFSSRYQQRLDFKQPNEDALRWIADRDDALINSVEVALDFAFSTETELDECFLYLDQHLVRRWHGAHQQIRLVSGTRYDAQRRAPNKLVLYPIDLLLHLEWRLRGAKAVRSAGIKTGNDLLQFDFHQFWKQRLLLLDVDREHLGRSIRNRKNRTRDRAPWIATIGKGFRINWDFRIGCIATRPFDTVQELLDKSNRNRIRRSLVRLDNSEFLPAKPLQSLL